MKQISYNTEVQVKITPLGHAILKSAYDNGDRNVWFTNELEEFVLPEVDEEGYSKVTLWKVMKYFGSYLDIGIYKTPFESDIRIAEENIKEIPFQKTKRKQTIKSKSINNR